jgi:uncharacterized membrane protein YuzA (DUF378 family)
MQILISSKGQDKGLTNRTNQFNVILRAVIFLGITFRLFHFFYNRSLWNDEMYLASSLVKMNFWDLATKPMDYEQKAPIGFLWGVKSCVMLFGKSEMALRLFPLLTGIAALFAFVPVARYFLGPLAVVVAVCIMAFSPYSIYHSVEIKQYSSELLAATLLLMFYCRNLGKMDRNRLLQWGLLGSLTVWFSFSSIFILVGMAAGICLHYVIKKNWQALTRSMIPFSIWAVSFGISYLLFTKNHKAQPWLIEWFQLSHGFMPFPPASLSDMSWFVHKLFGLFHYPLGLSWFTLPPDQHPALRLIVRMSFLALIFFVAGIVSIWRSDKRSFLVFTFPFLLHLIASALLIYPFLERLTFYLLPVLIIVVVAGFESISRLFSSRKGIATLLAVLLLFGPMFNSIKQALNPGLFGDFKKSYDREALLYIDKNYRQGDVVYVYWNNLVPYRYYSGTYPLRYKALEGNDHRFTSKNLNEYMQKLQADIAALKGNRRVWLIYNKILPNGNIGDRMYDPEWYFKTDVHVPLEKVHPLFSSYGKKIDQLETRNVNVVLFDLSK